MLKQTQKITNLENYSTTMNENRKFQDTFTEQYHYIISASDRISEHKIRNLDIVPITLDNNNAILFRIDTDISIPRQKLSFKVHQQCAYVIVAKIQYKTKCNRSYKTEFRKPKPVKIFFIYVSSLKHTSMHENNIIFTRKRTVRHFNTNK